MKESIDITNYNSKETDILFSKTVLSGRRIYYLDVKKNRKGELFLNITESKKVLPKSSSESVVHFEKHKIFLYKEEFDKFLSALNETISYANAESNITPSFVYSEEQQESVVEPISLNIDFWAEGVSSKKNWLIVFF